MVGKLLGGGLVLLGTALWCRGEIQARRRETDRAAELAAALGEMAAEIRSLRRPMPRLLERQARRALCGGCFARVLWGQPPAGAAFVGGGPVRGGAVHHLTDIEDDTWMWI